MLTLNDGRSELWQWDTGRTLAVDSDCSQVHFSNKVFGRSIDVDVADGVAIIPDVLLQTDKDLNVWAFVGTAENGYTKISKTFKVNRRNKPADYVFTPPDQTSLEEIKEKIDYLESKFATDIPSVDDTLTQSGQAADAAEVGARLSSLSEEKMDEKAMTATALGGAMADPAQEGDTQPVRIGADKKLYTAPGGASGDYIQNPPTASVGQTIVVKAVDESGKPTEWEAADMASGSGSGGGIHLIARVVTEANAASIEVTGLSTTAEVLSIRIYNPGSTCGGGLCITANGLRKVGYLGTIAGASTMIASVRVWLYRDGDTLYGRSRMANEGTNVYEWPEMGEITSIAVDSHYNDGTTKYFQTGTIFEIYEGTYPNVN